MKITFNPHKNARNRQKQGIDLAEIEAVFYDPYAITIEDLDHDEERFVTIGQDHLGRVVIVAYHYRGNHELRVISARAAQRHERQHDEREAHHARTR
ncbi:BrnT family toxin [Halochromatium roseum]|uniref:BrnT family toxin n=1 Tax=Halochromatium roseum TaxID=391920 RepID=UPI001912B451|nr:BrnT family toxin [Halochromatium roseum]MBK5938154.1 hypothetical protein [Halochromatium roseum]